MTQVLGTERRNIPGRQPTALCPGLPRVGEVRAENDVGERRSSVILTSGFLTPREGHGSGVQRGWGWGTSSRKLVVLQEEQEMGELLEEAPV